MILAHRVRRTLSGGGERYLEQALIEKVKAGDEHAFRVLVETYRNFVFHSVYAVLRNQKDAEDATQEVFLKIYLSLPQYENQGFKTWLTRIAVNHAIDMRRKAYRQREEAAEDFQLDTNMRSEESVPDQVAKKEMQRIVRKRIDELPENYRDVIYGFYIEEKTYEQMAKEQNVKRETVATKLHRARLWMKKRWKESDFL